MKRRVACAVIASAIAAIFFVACQNQNLGADYVGIWSLNAAPIQVETWVLTATTASVTDSGTTVGAASFSIPFVDTGAKHLQFSFVSGTGIYGSFASGTILYVTYSISGNLLSMSQNQTSYPPSATSGPYTRQ